MNISEEAPQVFIYQRDAASDLLGSFGEHKKKIYKLNFILRPNPKSTNTVIKIPLCINT